MSVAPGYVWICHMENKSAGGYQHEGQRFTVSGLGIGAGERIWVIDLGAKGVERPGMTQTSNKFFQSDSQVLTTKAASQCFLLSRH